MRRAHDDPAPTPSPSPSPSDAYAGTTTPTPAHRHHSADTYHHHRPERASSRVSIIAAAYYRLVAIGEGETDDVVKALKDEKLKAGKPDH